MDAYLTHHGVKGMKWGVRKDRSKSNAKARDKAKKRQARRESIIAKATRIALLKQYSDAQLDSFSAPRKFLSGMFKDSVKEIRKDDGYIKAGESFLVQFLDRIVPTNNNNEGGDDDDDD